MTSLSNSHVNLFTFLRLYSICIQHKVIRPIRYRVTRKNNNYNVVEPDNSELTGSPALSEQAPSITQPKKEKRPTSDVTFKKSVRSVSVNLNDVNSENQYTKLAEVVSPLWKMPYDKQLKYKYEKYAEVFRAIGAKLEKAKCVVKRSRSGLPCHLESVRPSPVQQNYRNKDEFSIHNGINGDPKTVGFFIGRPGHEGVVCVPGDHLVITKNSHKIVAKHFQNYIHMSPLLACHKFDEGGFWRNIRVRSNLAGDLMGIIIVHPQQMDVNEILEEQHKIRDYFIKGPGLECELKSLYFQKCCHTRCTQENSPFELLHGTPHIYESLSGLRLQISPDSFFQSNTLAAERLYDTIKEVSEVDKSCSLLDLCSGTGIIGLMMAKYVKQVVGIEVIKQAVEDAKMNAEVNHIENVSFIYGKVEDVVTDTIKSIASEDITAVVNPPRSGLHKGIIDELRKAKRIQQVIYVSCLPEGQAIANFVRLCRSKNSDIPGNPFVLTRAIPVDLFPQTHHCEVVLVFERY